MRSREEIRDPDYGLDALISRVAAKADISEEAATRAVDIVLTAVKARLPQPMARKLIQVVAGEESYDTPERRVFKDALRWTAETRGRWQDGWGRCSASVQKFIDSVTRLFKSW
jgi:uncharacterized protein (DUF2267 family)